MARTESSGREPSEAQLRAAGLGPPEAGFTLRDSSGHRIDPTTRQKVPRGYDIATAHMRSDEIVPFDSKLDRRSE